ncbi:L-threonylcarbamoyladenylate synthase [Rathayibacter toxicus]|uniref:Translation factor (SUA5) n=1 Tax=Rathayibacter toxicus TaxID=145458 RepID=A0A0C5BAE4_9MICO|nr:Sua5/YciO/YrdC/YwlC family protein [Rathayibacter toxicus]AJM77853.1 translation factor (SUA5) [Rathayibacter toxicus]ALS57957.1 translation factor (SUA5) [Rathayibacter toxicus]KKM44327.1 translation factor (SUA5) [Rathayibacter toxicus]PPG20357.1 translation factor (SUA5) [Rathayibacter toxicus]PPG45458.1 translation factor (SUA5) [Rathayibacter toxicus]
MTSTAVIEWHGQAPEEAVQALRSPGGLVVCATKVGYILMTTDGTGLDRKFSAKQRNRNKPGVVLCVSIDQLTELAELNEEILAFYRKHWDEDILLGCILPWKPEAVQALDETARELVRDGRGTSCFVIRFGRPAEQVATALWEQDRTLTFASSANPSGVGNRGRVANIGERIENEADVIVSADDYVASIQPGKDENSRHEQGVMVSMVDASGALIPVQGGERSITPGPVLIRRGLDYERIMQNLADHFLSWDYRQGEYY